MLLFRAAIGRPPSGWQQMLTEIAANRVGAVFVANISRLGRQMLPIEELRILASHHGTLLWLDNRFSDPSDPNDTVLTQITASFAQYENKKRSEHMTKARMAKARQGSVVSLLPVGWTETADGKYDYDPAVKDAIFTIIDTFMNVRSIRRTVKTLIQEGTKVPARRGRRITFEKPKLNNVRRLMVPPEPVARVSNPVAYAEQRSVIGCQTQQLLVGAWLPGQSGNTCCEYDPDCVIGDIR